MHSRDPYNLGHSDTLPCNCVNSSLRGFAESVMEGNQADLLEHVYTDSEKEFLLRIIKTKIAPILEALAKGGSAWAWEQWMMEVRRQRAVEAAIKLREDVVEVMKNSTRGNRTQEERDLIHQYVSKNLSCIPDDTSHQAMDMLCNEIDYYQAVDSKSIMFLQGDFGNCYYMIGDGKVDLYLVQGKDKEMDMGREYGALPSPAPFSLSSRPLYSASHKCGRPFFSPESAFLT